MIPLFALALIAAEPPAAAQPSDAPSPEMEKLLEDCSAHRFETTIDVTVEGKPKKSKVKLCGKPGQSDSAWLGTLKDAVEQTAANDRMTGSVRAQIITALTSEIARLSTQPAQAAVTPIAPLSPPALSPRPAAPADNPLGGYSTYQPLPPPPPSVVLMPGASSVAAAKPIPLLPRPRLAISCFTPGDLAGEAPCTTFERDTMLVVRAGENLPAGTSLRFVRNDDKRADVGLARLARGKSARILLPPEVCGHVVGGTLEIRIVRSAPGVGPDGQEVGSEGPYNLRC
jgi:hypothetical protein